MDTDEFHEDCSFNDEQNPSKCICVFEILTSVATETAAAAANNVLYANNMCTPTGSSNWRSTVHFVVVAEMKNILQ